MGYASTTTFIIYWNQYLNFYMTFQERDNGQRRVKEGYAHLTVKS